MSYKSILVHVDEKPRSQARVDVSLALAARFEAHVTALAVVPSPPNYRPSMPLLGPEIRQQQIRPYEERAEQALAHFSERARVEGRSAVETRTAHGDLLAATTLHARYNDLLVIGQYDPDDAADAADEARRYPELITLGVGRPVLVVPYAGRFPKLGEHIAVAWDAGREATRAVTDALPLLKLARKVTVLAVNADKVGRHGAEPGADIGLFLARHGVKVEVSQQQSGKLDVGTFLLSRLADMDADLLVMGAYGHSRLRELVVGGVTRTLLDSMTVPVIMSH